MLREQILQKAEAGFARLGIKAVNMDSLASGLRISKKTIYHYFSSKEELLAECLKRYITRNQSEILREAGRAGTALGAVLTVNRAVLYQSLALCPAFHEEMKRHARLQEMMVRHYIAFVRSEYLKYFTCGQEEGLFTERHNPRLTLDFLEDRLCLCAGWSYPPDKKQMENYGITLFTYLAGICTDKGRRQLETFTPGFFMNPSGQVFSPGGKQSAFT